MLETIAQLVTASVVALAAFLLTPATQKYLTAQTGSAKMLNAKLLATLVISGVITDLYNGVDTGEPTLEAQIVHIECRLTDVLLANGFNIHEFDPHHFTNAVLTESRLRRPLLEAIRNKQERTKCPA